jgi:uncharacterized protein (DUF2236 family)
MDIVSNGGSQLVSEVDLERQLEFIRATVADPVAGVFGPHSLTWRVDREAVLFLGAGRALLLQLAHPWVAAAIAEHSQSLSNPIGRFHRTFHTVYSFVFGTRDQAFGMARRLHRQHAAITGRLPRTIGTFTGGSQYWAKDVAAACWVYATLIETSLVVHDLVLPPLAAEERERYYEESKIFAALLGIPHAHLPPSWKAFAAYNEMMWASDILTVSAEAKTVAWQLLARPGSWLRVPNWYQSLTAKMLPHPIRTAFGLSYGERERQAAEQASTNIRRMYRFLPAWLRYVGPYHEAMGRIGGRSNPSMTTQVCNRLWIGENRL